MELEKIPIEVNIFGINSEKFRVFNDWYERLNIESLDVFIIIGKFAQKHTDLLEYSCVQDIAKVLAMSHQLHTFNHELRACQILEYLPMFNEVTDV